MLHAAGGELRRMSDAAGGTSIYPNMYGGVGGIMLWSAYPVVVVVVVEPPTAARSGPSATFACKIIAKVPLADTLVPLQRANTMTVCQASNMLTRQGAEQGGRFEHNGYAQTPDRSLSHMCIYIYIYIYLFFICVPSAFQ